MSLNPALKSSLSMLYVKFVLGSLYIMCLLVQDSTQKIQKNLLESELEASPRTALMDMVMYLTDPRAVSLSSRFMPMD